MRRRKEIKKNGGKLGKWGIGKGMRKRRKNETKRCERSGRKREQVNDAKE